jgi:hypothetical protein
VKIAVVVDWIHGTRRMDSFWKVLEMPALPPIGAEIFLMGTGRGCDGIYEVTGILWCQSRPGLFELDLEPYKTQPSRGTARSVVARMERDGWCYEKTHPLCEAVIIGCPGWHTG